MMNDSILTSRTPCDGKVSPVVRNTTKLNRTSNLDFLAKLQLICHQHTCNQVLLYIALKNAQSLSFLRDNLQVDQATDKSIVTFPTQLSSHGGVSEKLENYYQSNVQVYKKSLCES